MNPLNIRFWNSEFQAWRLLLSGLSVGILSINADYSEVFGISVEAVTSNDSCYKSVITTLNCFSLNGHECFCCSCAVSKSRVAPMRDLRHPAISIKHLRSALVSAELSGTSAKEMCWDPPRCSCSASCLAENMPFGSDFRNILLFFYYLKEH